MAFDYTQEYNYECLNADVIPVVNPTPIQGVEERGEGRSEYTLISFYVRMTYVFTNF